MIHKLHYNYYDVLKNNQPELISFVEKDLIELRAKNHNTPVGSTDNYNNSFLDYSNSIIPTLLKDARKGLGIRSNYYSDDDLKQMLSEYPEFQRLLSTSNVDYLTMTNFMLFGKKTFYFSDNLIEQLSMTSLDIPSEFVEPPFSCCLFVISSPIAIDAFYRIAQSDIELIDYFTPLSTFVITFPAEDGEGLREILFVTGHASYESSYMMTKRSLLIRANWNVEDMLKTDWQDIYKEPLTGDMVISNDESRFFEDGLLFYRILINSILYIGSNDSDIIQALAPDVSEMRKRLPNIKSTAKKNKLSRRLLALTTLNSSVVGSKSESIVINKKEQSSDAQHNLSGTKKVTKRFLVRGHWKRQPYGPKQSQRKLIFIKPFLKGPDMAELINKPYKVK